MPSIPLSFVVALLLAIFAIRVARSHGGIGGAKPFLPFLIACALQAVIVGLHWNRGSNAAWFIQPLTASALPALAWLGFVALRSGRPITARLMGLHGSSTVVVGVLTWIWRAPLDFVLAGLFVGYGIALLRAFPLGAEPLTAIRIGQEATARRVAVVVGGSLIVSGLLDLAIALDFGLAGGTHAVALVTSAQLFALVLLGLTSTLADGLHPAPEAPTPAPAPSSADLSLEDQPVVAAIETAMRERRLYADPDLTLDRLARRVGLPARQISAALNRSRGQNVSQIVNAYRVAEARRLLSETDRPIGEIMFEAGFQTKSNFNREFKRIVGCAPSQYRLGPSGNSATGSSGAGAVGLPS